MKPYLNVTIGYLIFGVTWILVSDYVAALIAPDINTLSWFQTLKGAFYICASGALIFILTHRACKQQLEEQAQRVKVYQKTVEASHHILMNYLNKMQLVTMEAEQCSDFDPEVLQLAHKVSDEAAHELKQLENMPEVTSEQIDAVVYRDLKK